MDRLPALRTVTRKAALEVLVGQAVVDRVDVALVVAGPEAVVPVGLGVEVVEAVVVVEVAAAVPAAGGLTRLHSAIDVHSREACTTGTSISN